VAHYDDHLAIQHLPKPGRRKDREGVFENRAFTLHTSQKKAAAVLQHKRYIFKPAERFYVFQNMILEAQGFLKGGQIIILVLFTNVSVPVVDWRIKNAGSVPDVERLTDINGFTAGRKHFPNPGGARPVNACYQDRLCFIIRHAVSRWFYLYPDLATLQAHVI
jgi:hypothetical protein